MLLSGYQSSCFDTTSCPVQISQLKELCALCEERDVDVQITTRKLAMVSLCMVFKDIAPGCVHMHDIQ